jgi:peptidoglycan biosynthesis protein MviN/MurJ (putative lipid II flippase)
MFVMLGVLRRRLGGIEGKKMATSIGKTVVAAGAAGIACWMSQQSVSGMLDSHAMPVKLHALAVLTVSCPAGMGVYLLCAILLRTEEVRQVAGLLRRRRRG